MVNMHNMQKVSAKKKKKVTQLKTCQRLSIDNSQRKKSPVVIKQKTYSNSGNWEVKIKGKMKYSVLPTRLTTMYK